MISQDVFFETKNIKGILDTISISAGKDDGSINGGGANNMMSKILSAEFRHSTTEKAISFFIKKMESLESWQSLALFMGGHGSPGSMETGWGHDLNVRSDENSIKAWREGAWASEFERLYNRYYHGLTLYSCNVGAEDDGASLLWKIAKHTDNSASAFTGLITLISRNNKPIDMVFQKGGEWQEAKSKMIYPPEPISAPAKDLNMKAKYKKSYFEIYRIGKIERIDFNTVEEISILNFEENISKIIPKAECVTLLEELFVSDQIIHSDGDSLSVLGMITSKLTIKTNSGINYIFIVYNNTYAVIEGQPISFFIRSGLLDNL